MASITAGQKNYLSILLAEREVPKAFAVDGVAINKRSLNRLSSETASKAIRTMQGLPRTEAANAVVEAVYALPTGKYRLADGTLVEWSNNNGVIFAVINGKPQWKRHLATGLQIVADGSKKVRAKKAAQSVTL